MRRVLATALLAGALAALVLVTSAPGDDGTSGDYEVRAIFDNGGFIVNDEDVRIAGANVGAVKSVDVSMPGEIVSLQGGPHAIPGKAVVVLDITDPGFKDFRQDASCLIRPQSLIGEKYVDCEPTQGRAPGTKPPPPLRQIPDGQPGAGQYLLPLERNGKAVDLDLIQNIQRLPYRERFRLIINELGAGLAARGTDLKQIVRRANPALRETDQVLKILAKQNKQLAQLATDSDTDLAPLARERTHISGFIRGSGTTAAATASRSSDLEAGLQKLPPVLRELRLTMGQLGGFSDAARPFFSTLGGAAPEITRATRLLGPFSQATTTSLKSLGNAADEAGPPLVAADPIVRRVERLAKNAQSPASNLGRFTKSLRNQKGFDSLLKFVYNTAGSVNGYDQYGHYLRTNILVSGCAEYAGVVYIPGCVTRFTGPGVQEQTGAFRQDTIAKALRDARTGGASVPGNIPDDGSTSGIGAAEVPGPIGPIGPDGVTGATGPSGATGEDGSTGATGPTGTDSAVSGRRRADAGVLNYLLGP